MIGAKYAAVAFEGVFVECSGLPVVAESAKGRSKVIRRSDGGAVISSQDALLTGQGILVKDTRLFEFAECGEDIAESVCRGEGLGVVVA